MTKCRECEDMMDAFSTCPCAHPEVPHTSTLVTFKDGAREEGQVPCECDAAHAGICCDCYEGREL